IGFAIPVNMAREVADQLSRSGKVTRGQLGVGIADQPAATSPAMQSEAPAGVIVTNVAAGSAAEKAGIKPGDVIVAVDGRRIVSAGQLRARVGLARPGASVNIELLRNGDRVEANAVLAPAQCNRGDRRRDSWFRLALFGIVGRCV